MSRRKLGVFSRDSSGQFLDESTPRRLIRLHRMSRGGVDSSATNDVTMTHMHIAASRRLLDGKQKTARQLGYTSQATVTCACSTCSSWQAAADHTPPARQFGCSSHEPSWSILIRVCIAGRYLRYCSLSCEKKRTTGVQKGAFSRALLRRRCNGQTARHFFPIGVRTVQYGTSWRHESRLKTTGLMCRVTVFWP